MGREKALLKLGGKPLIEHAVTKLRRVCGEVAILSSNPALGEYAPLVPDVHPGCGPMSGMEAALLHTASTWNLFLPVDVPFLPAALLKAWIALLPDAEAAGARVGMFEVEGVAQPTVTLVHREVRPFLSESIERGQYKLLPVLERAADELCGRASGVVEAGFWRVSCSVHFHARPSLAHVDDPEFLEEAKRSALWFANLNTPEEFQEAELHADVLGD